MRAGVTVHPVPIVETPGVGSKFVAHVGTDCRRIPINLAFPDIAIRAIKIAGDLERFEATGRRLESFDTKNFAADVGAVPLDYLVLIAIGFRNGREKNCRTMTFQRTTETRI